MKHLKWIAGLAMTALLLYRPGAALAGAREAMARWYYSVAPSLFPFMALMPLLTCGEAMTFYEAALGRIMRIIFRLPGAAASAWVIGMLAGSPAGCAAARRAAVRSDLNQRQLECLAAACCGLSPGFLITGVGASMLGSPAQGRVLLRSQLIVQALLLLSSRRAGRGAAVDVRPSDGDGQPMLGAVRAILTVCGYMVLFGAVARALRQVAGGPAGDALLCLMDVTSGAAAVSSLQMPAAIRLPLLSGVVGWGGACVAMQNMSALKDCGVRPTVFLLYRLAAAVLSALVTAVQVNLRVPTPRSLPVQPLVLASLCACAVAIPVLVRLKRTVS